MEGGIYTTDTIIQKYGKGRHKNKTDGENLYNLRFADDKFLLLLRIIIIFLADTSRNYGNMTIILNAIKHVIHRYGLMNDEFEDTMFSCNG